VRHWFDLETILELPTPTTSFDQAAEAAAQYRRASRSENTQRAYRAAAAGSFERPPGRRPLNHPVPIETAATTLIGRVAAWSSLKSWGIRLTRRSGAKKARVAVARKLAVVLLTMWRTQMPFRWTSKPAAAPN
jgi:hypothetical protein